MTGVQINEFCRFRFVSNVAFSPSGKELAFVVSKADEQKNRYDSTIYIRKNGEFKPLTSGGKEDNFIFLNDEEILFKADREEDTSALESHYYRISLHGGEAQKAFTLPIPSHSPMLLPGGDLIFLGSVYPGYEELYTGDAELKEEYIADQKENADYEVIEENPWWMNGGTYHKGAYDALFYYDRKNDKLRRLTPPGGRVLKAKLSADKKSIYYFAQSKSAYHPYDRFSFYRIEINNKEITKIYDGTGRILLKDFWLGDSFGIAALCDSAKASMGHADPDFFKLDYETLQLTEYAVWGKSIGSSVGSDVRRGKGKTGVMTGDALYFISTAEDSAYLMKLQDGVISKVLDRDGSVDCFDTNGTEIIMSALFDMKGVELYDGNGAALTHFNDHVLQGRYIAIPERCDTENAGHSVHGFVLKPIDYNPAKTYPVILDIHGGPKTVYGPVYYHEMQYWAGLGYFVIFCNPTGSDGGGDDFAAINGRYGTVDYEDIMAFTDTALAAYPQMDQNRLFETGGSYGGFMTNWIVGHTDRFRACATQRSIVNWYSFYGVSDIGIGYTYDQHKATPWNHPEFLWEKSPMRYLDNCKTPTLVLHSTEDYRCPVDQGYQMYTSLVANGVDARLVLFRGENHDLSRIGKPKHRIRRLKEITEWFAKYDNDTMN